MQLCAQLGIRALQADRIRVSQGALDRRERRARSPDHPQGAGLLEVRLKLLQDTAEPGKTRSRGGQVRERLARPAHLTQQHRALQQGFRANERIGSGARRDDFIELRPGLREAAGGGRVSSQLNPDARGR